MRFQVPWYKSLPKLWFIYCFQYILQFQIHSNFIEVPTIETEKRTKCFTSAAPEMECLSRERASALLSTL